MTRALAIEKERPSLAGTWSFTHDPWTTLVWGSLILSGGLFLFAGATLVWQSLPIWRHEGWGFLFGGEWFYRHELFGAGAMLYGSVAVAAIAVLLAVPLGVLAAVFLSEYLPRRLRWGMKVLVEALASVPSVVYGLFGVLVLREWVGGAVEPFGGWTGDTLLTAGLLLAVMALPLTVTLSDDALRGVAQEQRVAVRGLGLTRGETVLLVVLPQAWPAVVGATLLGLGRALGETIAVFLVVGRMDNQLPEKWFSLEMIFQPGQTLTSKLGGPETHLAAGDPLHWGAMMGLCLMLVAITVSCLGGARYLQGKGRGRA